MWLLQLGVAYMHVTHTNPVPKVAEINMYSYDKSTEIVAKVSHICIEVALAHVPDCWLLQFGKKCVVHRADDNNQRFVYREMALSGAEWHFISIYLYVKS